MRVITIQHREVLRQLIKNGVYIADYSRVSDNLIKPYKFMQESFGWVGAPVFLVPLGHYVELGGAKFNKDSVVIELDIPDRLCKVQLYYNWSDFIYFCEMPWEFNNAFNVEKFSSVEDWGKTVLDITNSEYNIYKADSNRDPLQVTVELLRKDWVSKVTTNIKLLEKYNDSGGAHRLIRLK